MLLDKIHHIAFAVHNLEDTIEFFRIFEIYPFKKVTIEDRNMKAVLFKIRNIWLEYLSPISKESILANFLKENGEGIHHLAFQCNKIKELAGNLPEHVLLPSRKSDVGNWSIVDIKPEFSMGVKIQMIEEHS